MGALTGAVLALSIVVRIPTPYPELSMALVVATDVNTPVRLNGVQPPMLLGALIVSGVFEKFGADAIITSATDGKHSVGSLHYAGLALDFRIRHIQASKHHDLVAACKRALGPEFDVVLEGTHLHVEYDV